MNPKQIGVLVFTVLAVVLTLAVSSSILENNDDTTYQVIQGATSGAMNVRNSGGMYLQLFDKVTTYKKADTLFFDGDSGSPINVRFNDGGTADISGAITFELSLTPEDQLQLHRKFGSFDGVKQQLIRQVVTEAIKQTAPFMKAEDAYSTRRSEFTALARQQIENGLFDTVATRLKEKDADGNDFIIENVEIKRDKEGRPVYEKRSTFLAYNIRIVNFSIQDIDFDKTIDELIARKKEAEQQKVVARANAEKAKQDAVTAREQGAARIALAKADEEVEKIKAVTQAQKEYEVAKFNKLQAEEDAKSKAIKGEAEARVAKLKVAAGLTPAEKAEFKMKTAIGVAEKLSTIKLPNTMIISGGGNNSQALNPFDAVGLESFMRINKKFAEEETE